MGNTESSSSGRSSSSKKRHSSSGRRSSSTPSKDISTRAKETLGDGVRELQANLSRLNKKLEEQDHPAAQFIDQLCSPYLGTNNRKGDEDPTNSFYSEDVSDEDESGSEEDEFDEEDETIATEDERKSRRRRKRTSSRRAKSAGGRQLQPPDDRSLEGVSSYSESETQKLEVSSVDDEDGRLAEDGVYASNKPIPLASSFAKKCYFTKQGIGSHTQHYEGLTLTGTVVLMLAAAMKLKGCPTICDEDLRRVEQTFPNQFSRLPDELLLSSGWRRISKFCHFSNRAIPDGVPFFREYMMKRA